jgi:hypothetical protein
LEPYPPEVGRWLATLRERAQPQNSHLAPGPSPAEVLRLLDLIEDLAARWRAQERLLVDDIRRLPTDEFIARALEKGEYRVDLTEGKIISGSTARPIGRLRPHGYVEVRLTLEGISRVAHVHRIVAIAGWGVDAVRGKQIAHLNHNKADNRIANLKALSAEEHATYDYGAGARRSYRIGTLCVRCGFRKGDGETRYRNRMTSGSLFGVNGPLCDNCYHVLWREREGKKVGA